MLRLRPYGRPHMGHQILCQPILTAYSKGEMGFRRAWAVYLREQEAEQRRQMQNYQLLMSPHDPRKPNA
jgi:hypothetical protein